MRLAALFASVTVGLGLIAANPLPVGAQTPVARAASAPNLFQMPQYVLRQRTLARSLPQLVRRGQFAKAEETLGKLIARYPHWPGHHYMLAATLALQGKSAKALESLQSAFDQGFSDAAMLARDPSFTSLRGREPFGDLLYKMKRQGAPLFPAFKRNAIPRPVKGKRALVDEANTFWERRSNLLLSAFRFPAGQQAQKVYTATDPALQLLNGWQKSGASAGNYGDLYDNRDNAHSRLPAVQFPQLTHVIYGDKAKAAGLHYGVKTDHLFNAITIGNSSTALKDPTFWRSQARLVLTTPRLAAQAYLQYANNQLYVYPEVKDHDPPNGDLFPANTPYMLISQGASGSDQPLLRAVAGILAAFPPDVKEELRKLKLVAPTVQMIFRSGMKPVRSADDYLSAKAHPSAFDGADIDLKRMLTTARNLRGDALPPRVRLDVKKESTLQPGRNYFGPTRRDEVLFNTPSAIARIHRSTDQERVMVVSAAGTNDPNGRPLRFVWKLLRGDPAKVSIRTSTDDGATAEIRVKWQDQRPVPFAEKLTSNRVDIGVFAYNGVYYSSPAFVSIVHPPGQRRSYGDRGQIVELVYNPKSTKKRYQDPVLYTKRGWRDRYKYTEDGQLQGWFRVIGSEFQRFTRHGARVVAVDGIGRPTRAEFLFYQSRRSAKTGRSIRPVRTNRFVHYTYDGPADRLGRAMFCNQPVCHHR